MNDFSLYLKNKRRDKGWTQQDFVSKLNELDPCFNGLDYVTYSRWERSITLPNIYKAFKIMDFFNEYHPSLFSNWLKKDINMKLIKYHDDHIENLKRYNDVNFIESISYNLNQERYDLLYEKELQYNELILNKVINFSCNCFNNKPICFEHFKALQKNGLIKAVVLTSDNIVIAHTLWFCFGEHLLPVLKESFHSLSFGELALNEKANCIYVQNFTAVSSDWWLFSISEIAQFVIKEKIETILILVSTQSNFDLMLKMGFKIYSSIKSTDKKNNIKDGDEYYERVVCSISRDGFLTNPIVIHILKTRIVDPIEQ